MVELMAVTDGAVVMSVVVVLVVLVVGARKERIWHKPRISGPRTWLGRCLPPPKVGDSPTPGATQLPGCVELHL